MGTDAIMEYQYSVIATIRDIFWGGKKAAPSPEYLTVIVILGIIHINYEKFRPARAFYYR